MSPLHIINAIKSPYIHFEHIDNIVVDTSTINVGNSAVTARCHIQGIEGDSLLKCYYRPKQNIKELYGDRYYPRELRVFTLGGVMEYADVLIDRWVEGTPLDIYAQREDCDFSMLSHAFDTAALELLESSWAHGDIKPENMILRPDGCLRLVDMDAIWRDDLLSGNYDEQGTPEYNHPKRPIMGYNKHIDDFPLALISTIIAASAIDPKPFRGALETRSRKFNPALIVAEKDQYLNMAMELLLNSGDWAHYDIAKALTTCRFGSIHNLTELFCHALGIEPKRPEIRHYEEISNDIIERKSKLINSLRTEDRKDRKWSNGEDERLIMMWSDGDAMTTIAHCIGRSHAAVRRRLSMLKSTLNTKPQK